VAIETGNGVLGASLPALLRGLPIKVIPLLFKPDGRFPVHEPNPLKLENLELLRRTVREKKCDVGIAFDGDGDRLAMVDEKGEPIPGDMLLCLMAGELLKRERKGTAVLYDLRSSKAVARAIEAAGGRPVETRVGHSHIKAALRREKAVFAGELSGHYYFRDFYCSDSGEMALFAVLSLLSSQDRPISELIAPHRIYHHTGEINFEVENADAILAAVKAKYSASAGRIYELDGVSVDMGDWWFNLRKSNTEPVVRLNLESLVSAAHRDEKKAEVLALIRGQGR
jgi:phosphomannomutase